MKSAWTIIPAVLFGLALLSEPVLLVPGSYFSGIGEAEFDRLSEAMNKPVSELRDNVARARIGHEVEVPADAERPSYLFRVRRDGQYLVRAEQGTALNVSFIEAGNNRLRRSGSSRANEARLSLESGALIYVEVLAGPRTNDARNFEITEPLRHADLDDRAREVVALGWDRWDFDPEALSLNRPGEPINGHLEAGENLFYLVEVTPGALIHLNLDSDEFDPFVEMWEVGNGAVQGEHSDDDGGSDNNSMLRVRAGDQTSYMVVKVRGYNEDGAGEFQLRIRQPEPRRGGWSVEEVATQEGLEIGELREGAAGAREAGYLSQGEEIFYVYGVTGPGIDIDLTSDDFDTYLEVWEVDTAGGFFTAEAEDDDSGGDQDSQLSIDVGPNSVLLVKVRGFNGSNSGRYELYVR